MKVNYPEQLKIISRIRLDETSKRIDCPFCNGKNTLGISRLNGFLKWHCFRASCEAHGSHEVGRSLDEIKEFLSKDKKTINTSPLRPIPSALFSIDNRDSILQWLSSVNSLEAYKSNLVTIKYNPADNRVMFGIKRYINNNNVLLNDNKIIGYTGRSLINKPPKWLKYGDTTNLFSCGKGKIGVLVEDAPSACAVGILEDYTGIALLGTALTPSYRNQLLGYEKIIICLDPDASLKAISFNKHLPNSTIKFIPNDLKNYGPEGILKILKE